MSKIRINELARQLEIPSHTLIEMLPELGVTEKKTHSSSIDESVAELVRKRIAGNGGESVSRGATVAAVEEAPVETEHAAPPAPAQPAPEPILSAKPAPGPAPSPVEAASAPT